VIRETEEGSEVLDATESGVRRPVDGRELDKSTAADPRDVLKRLSLHSLVEIVAAIRQPEHPEEVP